MDGFFPCDAIYLWQGQSNVDSGGMFLYVRQTNCRDYSIRKTSLWSKPVRLNFISKCQVMGDASQAAQLATWCWSIYVILQCGSIKNDELQKYIIVDYKHRLNEDKSISIKEKNWSSSCCKWNYLGLQGTRCMTCCLLQPHSSVSLLDCKNMYFSIKLYKDKCISKLFTIIFFHLSLSIFCSESGDASCDC